MSLPNKTGVRSMACGHVRRHRLRWGLDIGSLNARGEPLLPADLLRNFIFLRAGWQGEPAEQLYEEYWRKFDDPFWRREVRQGRLSRPRSDLFLQHFLASRQATDIPIKHLFVEYKFWIQKTHPFGTVREELETLARQGDDFRRLMEPPKNDPLVRVATFLQAFEVSTAYPFLLAFLNRGPTLADLEGISETLESYLLRRAVCGLTPKNYNRIFLQMTRALQEQPATSASVRTYLAGLTGESSKWPSDEEFRDAWLTKHAYQTLNSPKISYILLKLSATYLDEKSEQISIDSALTVEHILPQDWLAFWPLQDGSKGMSYKELWDAAPGEQRAEATRRRNAALQTLGNLTIISDRLNPSLSNAAWTEKKPELLRKSLQPINQMLHNFEIWDESAIALRGTHLFIRALSIWPKQATTA